MKLEPMKPAPPVTRIVCASNIGLHRGDQHAGMPRGCYLPAKPSIVIKKDGLSPALSQSSILCLARFSRSCLRCFAAAAFITRPFGFFVDSATASQPFDHNKPSQY